MVLEIEPILKTVRRLTGLSLSGIGQAEALSVDDLGTSNYPHAHAGCGVLIHRADDQLVHTLKYFR